MLKSEDNHWAYVFPVALWVVPLAERLQFPGPLLIRIRCSDTSWKAALNMKVQHEGALTHLCIIRKNGQVTHTARQVACHSLNNSRGKRSSITHTYFDVVEELEAYYQLH